MRENRTRRLAAFRAGITRNAMGTREALVFVAIALVVASFFYVHAEHVFDVYSDEPPADEALLLEAGATVRQEIPNDPLNLMALSIRFGTYDRKNEGNVVVSLYEDDVLVQEWDYLAARLSDNEYQTFYLDEPHSIEPDHDYCLTVTDEYEGDNGVAVWTSEQADQAPLSSEDGEGSTNSVCFRLGHTETGLRNKVLAGGSIIFAMVVALVALGFDERVIMSVTLVSLGLVYFWLCPLGMAPDERAHFMRAFEVSCLEFIPRHIGDDGAGGSVLPAALENFSDPSAVIDWGDTAELAFRNTALYSPLSYLPQAVGIRIARFLTNNVSAVFYAGRLGNFVASMALCIAALHLIPYGRKVIFMAMMFPLSLQEMISMAPDGFTIGLSIFLLSYLLHLSYRPGNLKTLDFILLTTVCLVLSQVKIVYVTLVFLILIVPREKIGGRRSVLLFKVGVPLMAMACNLVWLGVSAGYLVEFNPGVDSASQAKYVLTNIWQFYLTAVRTTIAKAPFYVSSMIGSSMGALNIGISSIAWIAFLILYVYEVGSSRDVPSGVRTSDRVVMLLVFLACCALIYASLYVQWTPLEDPIVNGIQGRYFTPIISLLALWAMQHRQGRYAAAGNAESLVTRGSYFYVILLVLNGITALDMIAHYVTVLAA